MPIIMKMKNSKKEKTRKEKVRSTERMKESSAFQVKAEWLKTEPSKARAGFEYSGEDKKYFRADLTKTLILTMLVLALETALWQYFSKH